MALAPVQFQVRIDAVHSCSCRDDDKCDICSRLGCYPLEKGDAVTGAYEIERDGQYVRFYIGGALYGTLSFYDFDDRPLCKAQYGVEVHSDPWDHVPGLPGSSGFPPLPANHCTFSDVEISRIFGSFEAAQLDGRQVPYPSCYDTSKFGNSFDVWDKRQIANDDCPSP